MNDVQKEIWEILEMVDGETAIRLITDWYGLYLFDKGFLDFLKDEGY